MKRRRICISGAALAVLLAGFLWADFGLCAGASGRIEPTGADIGAVQFDAVIELNRYSPRSMRHDYTMIFARYWVAPDYYRVAVVWAEPQSTDMFFAVRPPGLRVASTPESFNVHHESIKEGGASYVKPVGERGVFRHKFGNYPMDELRFADQGALAARIYAADLQDLKDANQPRAEAFDVSTPATEGADARDVGRVKVHASGGRIDSMELFDARGRMLKSINYEYEDKGGASYLHRQTVSLPERPIMVGFKGEGMKVTLDGKEYRYRDLEVKEHAGQRICTVEYEPVTLGDKKVSLPVRATVRGGKEEKILRCVHLMNFKKVELDAAGVEEAARQFAAVSPEGCRYEQFRLKSWKKAPTEIEQADLAAIRQLRAHFENDASVARRCTGERLKRLNILMELNMMLGETPKLERCYQMYLATLAENKLLWTTLAGGYGVIETAMFRGRRTEAEKLLSLWVEAVLDIHGDESILLFARRQLAKNRLWPTAALLEAFSSKKHAHPEVRFEAEALRCTALAQSCTLLRTEDVAKKGLAAEVEANWVASIGKDGLDRMLAESVVHAGQSFAKLPVPAESQQTLKAQLDNIDKEIGKSKTIEQD